MSDNLKSKAVKGVSWALAETYSRQAIQFLITIILARILTPNEYGLIGMLAIFIGLSTVFIDGGFSSALIQRKDRSDHDFSTVFFINVASSVLVYFILFFCAPLISDFYSEPILKSILRIYALSLIIESLGSTSTVKLTIKLDFKTTTKISFISAVISGIFGIFLAYSGWGVWALVTQTLTNSSCRLILLFSFVRWFPSHGFNYNSFKKLFSFGSKLLGASILSSLYENATGTVIGKQFSASQLAYYNQGQTFNTLVNGNVTNVLGKVSYPLLSTIQDNDLRLQSVYKKYIQMSAFLTFPCLMLLCGIAKPLILFLLTAKWAPAIILIQILTFAFISDGIIVSNLNLIKIKGRSDIFLKLEIIKKSIGFIILLITIMMDSIIAICIGRAIYGGIIALYLNTLYTKRLMGYGFLEQFKDYWPYLLFSLIILGISLLISNSISNSIIALIANIILCPSIYLLLCKLFNLYAFNELLTILKFPKRQDVNNQSQL